MASLSEHTLVSQAVFVDRDGVINPLVYNPLTDEYESPHYVEDISIFPYVISALKKLVGLGYKLFLISNQPSYAKGKTSLENIQTIHAAVHTLLIEQSIHFEEYYYCYHHPDGIVPDYSFACECRKPKSKFLKDAANVHGIDLKNSWFIGDQDSDVECGQSEGLRTILLTNKYSLKKRGKSQPDYVADNLSEAVELIGNLKKAK